MRKLDIYCYVIITYYNTGFSESVYFIFTFSSCDVHFCFISKQIGKEIYIGRAQTPVSHYINGVAFSGSQENVSNKLPKRDTKYLFKFLKTMIVFGHCRNNR